MNSSISEFISHYWYIWICLLICSFWLCFESFPKAQIQLLRLRVEVTCGLLSDVDAESQLKLIQRTWVIKWVIFWALCIVSVIALVVIWG